MGPVQKNQTTSNYYQYLLSRSLAIVNVCAYRSPKISKEPENMKAVKRLPSAKFQRDWLIKEILPDADSGRKVIVGKRHGMWDLPESVRQSPGFITDPAPVSPHLSRAVLKRIEEFV